MCWKVELCLRPRQQRRDFGDFALGVAARIGAPVDGHLGGVLGAFAAVDRVAECLAVVAGGDGFFGSLECAGGGGEFLGGKSLGAGGARRFNRALRLIHFFVGRLGATGREKGDDDKRQSANGTKHVQRVYASDTRENAREDATTRVNQLP